MKETEEAKTSTSKPKKSIFSRFETNDYGIYQINRNNDGEESSHWIAPPISIDALTHDSSGENYGHLVRFRNQNHHEKTCILLYSELIEGLEAAQRLFNLGFKASEKRKDLEALRHYILQSNPATTICAVPSHGWHHDSFIHNDEFDLEEERKDIVILDPNITRDHRYHTAGTLQEWRFNVGRLCEGNTRLLLAVSAALAAPLLHLLKAPNIGLHLRGLSSLGKTTVQYAAGSVWGGGGGNNDHGFLQSWRTTSNALELQCALHNDAILCLDEMGQVSEKEVGEIIYCLGNGIGKGRATRDIKRRPIIQFRLVFLSSGEKTLREMMLAAGKQVKGGQEARLIDIPADVGRGYGIFEYLHGHSDGAALSSCINQAAQNFYGTPSRAFVQHLIENGKDCIARAKELRQKFVDELKLKEHQAAGEIYRIAEAFGLIAAAGEIATDAGITGWDREAHEAKAATRLCFEACRYERGGGYEPHDVHAGMEAVAYFLARYAYRFQNLNLNGNSPGPIIHDRAGFCEEDGECRRYYIFRQVFEHEICRGYDHNLILKELRKHQYLVTDPDGEHLTFKKFITGEGHNRFIAVLSTICADR